MFRPHYTLQSSLGIWQIRPIRNREFKLFLDDLTLDTFLSAEAAALSVRAKVTGHRAWDKSEEDAPPSLDDWKEFNDESRLSDDSTQPTVRFKM